jgi:hypothetical protein
MLKFSFHNSKLNKLAAYLGLSKKQVVGFDLPAGYTCKMAKECKAFANKKTGKITDGVNMRFRCYAATSEMIFTNVRLARWHNYNLLRGLSVSDMIVLINESLPAGVKIVRIHSGGDYFNKAYFSAWCEIAKLYPEITFFGYTKHLDYVRFVRTLALPNFKLQYSLGGTNDNKVTDEPIIRVVNTPADSIDLPVACVNNPADDFDYIMAGKSFAIAVHGMQPRKSK